MSNKSRTSKRETFNALSKSTQAEAELRSGTPETADATMARVLGTTPVAQPTDAELNAAIDPAKNDGADVAKTPVSSNGHNFKPADAPEKKGPYATEAEARLPENVFKNAGKVAWELYEVELPNGTLYGPLGLSTVYTWACNADLAIAWVARKAGWEAGKAGAKAPASGLKTKLTEAQEAAKKAEEENDRLRAKLAEMGITL